MAGKSETALLSHEPEMRTTAPCSLACVDTAAEPQEGAGSHLQRQVPAEGSGSRGEWTRAPRGLRPELPHSGSRGGPGLGPPRRLPALG